MRTEKQNLREQALRHRKLIHTSPECSEELKSLLFRHFEFTKTNTVGCYWPINYEFDVKPVMEALIKKGAVVALPVMQEEKKPLIFIRWDGESPLQKKKFGVLEPHFDTNTDIVKPDTLLVPLLAFDRKGFRLGYGGGFYDATIEAIEADRQVTTIGIAYNEQLCLFPIPVENHDKKLDYVITPTNLYTF